MVFKPKAGVTPAFQVARKVDVGEQLGRYQEDFTSGLHESDLDAESELQDKILSLSRKSNIDSELMQHTVDV